MTKIVLDNIGEFDLRKRPETYRTILKDNYGQNSLSTSTRRKMSSLLKYGLISFKPIKNTIKSYGKENIFYTLEKEYFIVFTKKSVFFCDNINTMENNIKLINCFELNCINWLKKGDKNIKMEEVVICF